MAYLKTFICDICGHRETEEEQGDGVHGMFQIIGVKISIPIDNEGGEEIKCINPVLCLDCFTPVGDLVDKMYIEKRS